MRILYLSYSSIPSRTANSIHVMKMCQALAMSGHEVTLIAPDVSNIEADVKDIYEYYGVNKVFDIKKIPLNRGKGKSYYYAMKVATFVAKERPDVVYGRFLLGCYLSSFIRNIPIIFESHQPINDSSKIQDFFFIKLIKKKNFSRLVVISDALNKYYKENYNLDSNKILTAHDGADPSPKGIKQVKLKLDGMGKVNVGYIGHLYQGKGMELIAELVMKCPWANFHIVGGVEKDIEYWKDKLSEFHNVYFYGFVPHSSILNYGYSMDILLAPYQSKVFGHTDKKSNIANWMSPLKIFEYMSLGKPIICSDLSVLREIINNNVNGFLCDPNNIDEWIKQLEFIYRNNEVAESIGLTGQKDFLEKYTWSKRAGAVIDSNL